MIKVKRKALVLLLGATLFVACQETPKPSTATTPAPAPPPTPEGCYLQKVGADITAIQIKVNGSEVSGHMAWEPAEKDSGRGAFKGTLSGDLITVVWEYMIEGSVQKEEILFKVSEGKIAQAVGELDDRNGTMVLKDKSKAEFKEVYNKVGCSEIEASMIRARETEAAIKANF